VARAALDDAREAAERRALRLAHYDEVTGLPNRRLFAELAGPTLERSRRQGLGCAILHIEMDRLDGIHDAYGRNQIDAVLTGITQRIRLCVRAGDLAAVGQTGDDSGVVARLGDSAFSILVADLDSQERASLVAQRLLTAIAQPIVVDAQTLVLSASLGIAMFPGDAPDLAGLTRCAEQAARVAVKAGGAQYKFFDDELNAKARDRVVLETELRQAIQSGQLYLQYQPKVDVHDGRIVGAEALIRWKHPQRGPLLPEQFIGLAEESGLIVPMTNWVLHTACGSLRRWADEDLTGVPLSVNLSASSFGDARLPDQLDELMSQYGLNPASLVLELTETVLMRDSASAIEVLGLLRSKGFGVSLDDFGTGYSSLSYLKRLPVSELKIDRAFVTDVAHGGRDGALAAVIITLGRELGLQVVAEGIETAEQAEFLRSRGCTLQQGYLHFKPLFQDEFEQLLKTAHP
jgi:diguanylate cyclase (GGDEF)-like protein